MAQDPSPSDVLYIIMDNPDWAAEDSLRLDVTCKIEPPDDTSYERQSVKQEIDSTFPGIDNNSQNCIQSNSTVNNLELKPLDIKLEPDCQESESLSESLVESEDLNCKVDVQSNSPLYTSLIGKPSNSLEYDNKEICRTLAGDVSNYGKCEQENDLKFPISHCLPTHISCQNDTEILVAKYDLRKCSVPCLMHLTDLQSQKRSFKSKALMCRIKCDSTNKSVGKNSNLKRVRVNANTIENKRHKCGICGKSYVSVYYLKSHTAVVHNNVQHGCQTCGKSYRTKLGLKSHVESCHHRIRFTCVTCDKSYRSKCALKSHIAGTHNKTRFSCDVCGKMFSAKKSLIYHIVQKHQMERHKCKACVKCYSTRQALKKHVTIVHNNVKYKCPTCGKLYLTKDGMTLHIKGTHNKVQHKCEPCGKVYISRDSVRRHIESVHSMVRYNCQICGGSYARNSLLKRHIESNHKNFK